MRRQDFLHGSLVAPALAAGASAFSAPARGQSRGEGQKLNVTVIGAGGRARAIVCDENLVGLCDVDERKLAEAVKSFPKPLAENMDLSHSVARRGQSPVNGNHKLNDL